MTINHDSARFKTPVLLVIFNRPQTTKRVFEAIRNIKPPRLYIAADGPRAHTPGEREKCNEARKIVEQVDWDCEVKTLFRDTNLNCGRGPSSAFSWFFDHESEGIILEDDCLPSESFFWFCQDLLERYRDDTRIMHIGGNNFLKGWQHDGDYSYYFSRNGHIWGWATWRRAWKLFDYRIELYEKIKREGLFNGFFDNDLEKLYRLRKFDQTIARKGKVDWWDYQWDFARFVNSGLAIVPQKNLVKNVGFGGEATHTRDRNNERAEVEALDIDMPLRHPPFVIRDIASDRRYFGHLIREVIASKIASLKLPIKKRPHAYAEAKLVSPIT